MRRTCKSKKLQDSPCPSSRSLRVPAAPVLSSCQWDVSGLLLDSEPFSHDTVKCWVGCAYSALYVQAELDEDDIQQLSTF
jgi:hypothetical protein